MATSRISPDQWRILEPFIDGALERDGVDRAEFLRGLDPTVRHDVEAVLAECEDPPTLLDVPAAERFARLVAEPADLPPVLGGRYEIERVLGRGGMATVYLAHDDRHARKVAVKVLSAEVAAFVTRERFLAEIHIAARLTHPHILSVHDSGETDGHLFFVMPYVEGESLRHRLQRERRLALDNALEIAREVADALTYAHERGVIHRDIKPENILLESGHAVVADFGIARAVDVAGLASMPGASFATGTPAYMSPEQATGAANLDGRSDLYSLGCVLYEMLAGQPPFAGPPELIVDQHRTATPPSVCSAAPETPPAAAEVIDRALAKRPVDRFATVADFARTLEASASSLDVRDRRARPRVSGGRLVLSAAAAIVLVSVGALALNRRLTDGASPAPPSRQPSSFGVAPSSPREAREPNAVVRRNVASSANPRANDAYLNGMLHLNRRAAPDRIRSIQEFQRAVTLDPRFAAAHARLAEAYVVVGYFGYPGAPPARVAFPAADSALQKAFALDSSMAEAYLTLAKLRWMYAPNLRDAERAAHRALELDPTLADAHFEHARILSMRLEADSAIREVNEARRLDPLVSARHGDVAWVHWVVRRYVEAESLARAALTHDSTSSTAYLSLGGALAAQEKFAEAISAFERGIAVSGNRLFLPQLGYAYARAGRVTEANATLAQLRELYAGGLAPPYYIAQVYLALGNKDSALTWLETADRERSGHVSFLHANAVWDPIRSDTRFRAIVGKIGLDTSSSAAKAQ